MIKRFLTVFLVLVSLHLSSCSRSAAPAPTPTSGAPAPTVANTTSTASPIVTSDQPWLATPVADSPAAGICASFEGQVVRVQILPGIPDPRCVQVRGEQLLSIYNGTEGTIEVGLGPFTARLAPGGEYLITRPFESYLAPGVHVVNVTPCCGGEIVYGIDLGN